MQKYVVELSNTIHPCMKCPEELKLCTYWLSGRAGRENIWLEVMAIRNERSEVRTEWPRAKYFSVRPDLTQSISILSYDKIRIFCFKQVRTPFWAGRTAFYCPLTKTRTAPITWLFCMVFIRAARAGKYGHMIICTYWLSGRAGRENIWLEVMAVRNERSEVRTEWPRAKYFSVRPDLTQSISILSYDKIRIFCLKQRPSRYVRLFERAGRLFTARSPKRVRPPSRDFSVWFLLGQRERGNTVMW